MISKLSTTVIIFGLSAMTYLSLAASDAVADGRRSVCTTTYGGATECREEEVPSETVTHEVTEVNTGIVENALVALGLFVVGYTLMVSAGVVQAKSK